MLNLERSFCDECDDYVLGEVNAFFVHHRGVCSDHYHAWVAVREARLIEMREAQEKAEAATIIANRRAYSPPKPAKPRMPRAPKPLPFCKRACGTQLAHMSHTLCKPCRSEVSRERWVKYRAGMAQWSARTVVPNKRG